MDGGYDYYARDGKVASTYVRYEGNYQKGEVYRPKPRKEGVHTPAAIDEEREWPPDNRREEGGRPTSSGVKQGPDQLNHLQDDQGLGIGATEGQEKQEDPRSHPP